MISLVPRAVATVGRVVSTIFRQCDGYTTHFYVFWDADYKFDIKNFKFQEKLTARAIWNFYNCNGGPKIQDLMILTKKGHIGWEWREDFISGLKI